MERKARQARSSLALVAVALLVFSASSASAGQKKNRSFMELEFQLKSADGVPLADFPMAVGSFYDDAYEVSSTTDRVGKFYRTFSKDRAGLPLIEPFLKADAVIRQARMSIYLPSASRYGDYQVSFIAPKPSEGPNFDGNLGRPREVPTEIVVGKNADRDAQSTFAHGAYYHPTTGGLMTTTVIGNGELRQVPVTARGSRAFLEKVTVSERPRLQISSTATPLRDRPGWRFKVELMLEAFDLESVEQVATKTGQESQPPSVTEGVAERVVLKRDFEVRARGLTLILESAGYEHGSDLSNESNARVRVRQGDREEFVELVRRHPSDAMPTFVLGHEIFLEVSLGVGGPTQAIVWVR